ncbi:MAG: hypothetical protein ACOZAM_23155 [Pseudomonadota bacterium]
MATQDLEKLIVRVEANLKQYESAFAKANGFTAREMRKIERQVQDHATRVERYLSKVGAGLKGFGAGFIGGLGIEQISRAIVGVVKDVASLADEAKRAGISFEDLQLVADVAADAGVETANVVDLFQKLNKAIGEAVTKGNDLGKILALNGIPLKDQSGQVRDTLTLFYEVVDLISRTRSQGEASAISMAAFSRSAEDALPFLQQGSAAIKQGAQAARDAGRYMSNELGQTADDIDDRWAQMWRGFEKGGKAAVVRLVSFMQQTDPYVLGERLRQKILDSYSAGAAGRSDVLARQKELQERIATATQEAFGFGGAGAPDALLKAWKDELAGINAQLEISAAFLDAIKRKELPGLSRNAYETGRGVVLPEPDKPKDKTKKPPRIKEPDDRSLDEFQREIEMVNRETEALRLQADSYGLTAVEAEKLRVVRGLLKAADEAGIKLTPELSGLIDEIGASYGVAAAKAEELAERQAHLEELNGMLKDSVSGFLTDIRQGVEPIDALTSALGRLADQLIQMGIDSLFNAGGPGGAAGGLVKALGFAKGGIMTGRGSMPLRRYAGGGVANSPQLAMFGEGSKPEAYVPLPDGRSIPVKMQLPSLAGAGRQAGGNVVVNVINNSSADVRTQEKQGPNVSKQIDMYIDDRIGRFMTDHKGASILNAAYGIRPVVKRR